MFNKWISNFIFIIIFTLVCLSNISAVDNHSLKFHFTEPYSSNEIEVIKQYLFNNIATEDRILIKEDNHQEIHSIPGAVLASPSKKRPGFVQDYLFHWTRDAGLVMNEVAHLYSQAQHSDKMHLKSYLVNYINFERKAQKQISRPGEQTLGQPKFNIDGTIWEGEWGRPQNDGPALRAATMIAIANIFLQEKDEKYVRGTLIDIIKTDLDYIVTEWQTPAYDLWEEIKDKNLFFTKMVQRKGLIEGAKFFDQMGDFQRADNYSKIANQMTESLNQHWNLGRGYFTESVSQRHIKGGGINSSIILGVLHGDIDNPADPFAANNERVMSSIYYIRNAFSGLYRVNIDNQHNSPMLGRYSNDIYDGDQDDYGNPWILTTNALGQYYYKLANIYLQQGKIVISKVNKLFFTQIDSGLSVKEEVIKLSENPEKFYSIVNSLIAEGDKAVKTAKRYSVCYEDASCLHFSEQIDRSSGRQTSAMDLTWGYTSVLTAMQARDKLI